MCKGVEKEEERRSDDGGCRRLCSGSPNAPVRCELCDKNATVYCEADAAFLCRKCDTWVHSANFLARRHLRSVICSTCRKLTRRFLVGDNFNAVLPEIRTMARGEDEVDSTDHKVPFVFL
ncbi:PREDICTED: B-box domain protein 30-like [Camelina sativa]|uniref:B-box domain protein 30-like n=1 Tax=Camelina sativa TaxID=90675 RepID=A0ABM0V2U2_CAMSA|nr:PREDICTED: B-box domain protein 30-like [Camelina sativa]